MELKYIRPFGHAWCPHCNQEFNLEGAVTTFLEPTDYGDTLVYIMCPECHELFQTGSDYKRATMSNICFVNLKLSGLDSDGISFPWAVTTILTLSFNNNDLVKAFENGHGLTKQQYFDVCAGKYEISEALGGVRFITSTSKEAGSK